MTQQEFLKELDKMKKTIFPEPSANGLINLGKLIRAYYKNENFKKDDDTFDNMIKIITEEGTYMYFKNDADFLAQECAKLIKLCDKLQREKFDLNNSVDFYVTQSKALQNELKGYEDLKKKYNAFVRMAQDKNYETLNAKPITIMTLCDYRCKKCKGNKND